MSMAKNILVEEITPFAKCILKDLCFVDFMKCLAQRIVGQSKLDLNKALGYPRTSKALTCLTLTLVQGTRPSI